MVTHVKFVKVNMTSVILIILLYNIKYANLYQNLIRHSNIKYNDNFIGHNKVEKMYPFMVRIYINKAYKCGGSIIAPKWILTAAHCLYYSTPQDRVISPFLLSTVGGIMQLNKTKHADHRLSESIHVHKEYSPKKKVAEKICDIGLIKVRVPYHKNNVIELTTFYESEKSLNSATYYCIIMGWGKTETGNNSNDLRELSVFISRGNKCDEEKGYNRSFCVVSLFGTASLGDSGGPLTCNGLLYGVCSRGDMKDITVYTRVDYYLDWIDAIINSAIANKCIHSVYLLQLFVYFVAL